MDFHLMVKKTNLKSKDLNNEKGKNISDRRNSLCPGPREGRRKSPILTEVW